MDRVNALSQASVYTKAPGVGAREFTRRSPCRKTPVRLKEMDRVNALSQASVYTKAPGVGAREFTRRCPYRKTPVRRSQGDIMLRIALGWTLYFCAVSLANGSDQVDVNAIHGGTGKQGDPNFHGAPDDLQERLQTPDGEELPEPLQVELPREVPSAALNLTTHALQSRAVPSAADGESFFEGASAEAPEDLSLDLTSKLTSSSCGDTKCSEGTSQEEMKLLTAETDAGASQASHPASSYSLVSNEGGGDSVLSSGGVTGTHLSGISQADQENVNTLVQPQPEVSDTVLPPPVHTPTPVLSAGAVSDAAPSTGLHSQPPEPPDYGEALRQITVEVRSPSHMNNMDLADNVTVPFQQDPSAWRISLRKRSIKTVFEVTLICILMLLGLQVTVRLIKSIATPLTEARP